MGKRDQREKRKIGTLIGVGSAGKRERGRGNEEEKGEVGSVWPFVRLDHFISIK